MISPFEFLIYMKKKIIVIPDVHGRSFWRKAIEKINDYDEIIFLGDYVDPYFWERFTREDAIKSLEDIIEFKKNNEEKVILLIGNHDFQYIDKNCEVKSRFDYKNQKVIHDLFINNIELFRIAHKEEKFLFSHSGILKPWVKRFYNREDLDLDTIVSILNNQLIVNAQELDRVLIYVGRERGGRNEVGSCIWGDFHEFTRYPEKWQYPEIYQIFGHTQQEIDPVITDTWACLDCRRAFSLIDNKIEELSHE